MSIRNWPIVRWLVSEYRLIVADAWRKSPDGPIACTRANPKVAALDALMRAKAAEMEKKGESINNRSKRIDPYGPTILRGKP